MNIFWKSTILVIATLLVLRFLLPGGLFFAFLFLTFCGLVAWTHFSRVEAQKQGAAPWWSISKARETVVKLMKAKDTPQ